MPLQVDPVRFRTLETVKEPYVKLVAESNEVFEKKKVVYILLSTRRGYIFIQTDKTIYNPGQQGKRNQSFVWKQEFGTVAALY